MSIGYLPTENIFVFPSTRRMNKQVSARLVSEASLANIVNKLIETDGFVITPEPETGEYINQGFVPTDPFEFNVHGYYFKASSAQDIINSVSGIGVTSIYANIYLDVSTDPNYVELKASDSQINELDDNDYFKGLTFSSDNLSEAASNPADYSLLLFRKEILSGTSTEGWVVPPESRLKFVYMLAMGVDGGEILAGDNPTYSTIY